MSLNTLVCVIHAAVAAAQMSELHTAPHISGNLGP